MKVITADIRPEDKLLLARDLIFGKIYVCVDGPTSSIFKKGDYVVCVKYPVSLPKEKLCENFTVLNLRTHTIHTPGSGNVFYKEVEKGHRITFEVE